VKEHRQTQVDAAALNDSHVLFFESKFTETGGGSCSQSQCNVKEIHTIVNKIESKCPLTEKKIRYWEFVDKIFKPEIYSEKGCPFSGSWYQYMRNLTVCYAVAKNKGKKPVFILTYVDGQNFPIAQEIKSKEWTHFKELIKTDEIILENLSYQDLMQIYSDTINFKETDENLLNDWVKSKIRIVSILKEYKII